MLVVSRVATGVDNCSATVDIPRDAQPAVAQHFAVNGHITIERDRPGRHPHSAIRNGRRRP